MQQAQYQKAVVQLFPALATSLTGYAAHLELLAWSKDLEQKISSLVPPCSCPLLMNAAPNGSMVLFIYIFA